MKKVLRKIPFSISILWLPYLFLLRIVPMQKIVLYIFMMLTIHELAHILIARLFHYPIRKIIIYPFGLLFRQLFAVAFLYVFFFL